MSKYNTHPLALNDAEELKFQDVKKRTGFGVKKIFMAMVEALYEKPEDIVGGQPIGREE